MIGGTNRGSRRLSKPLPIGETRRSTRVARPASLVAWAIHKRILRGKLRHAAQRALLGQPMTSVLTASNCVSTSVTIVPQQTADAWCCRWRRTGRYLKNRHRGFGGPRADAIHRSGTAHPLAQAHHHAEDQSLARGRTDCVEACQVGSDEARSSGYDIAAQPR